MQYHIVSNIFPLMTSEEFASLKRDISEYGLREPIVVHDDQILDGPVKEEKNCESCNKNLSAQAN